MDLEIIFNQIITTGIATIFSTGILSIFFNWKVSSFQKKEDTGIEISKKLLENDNMKVYEIGAKLGYSDTEYFSRSFRQAVGVTPSEFRQNLK